MKYVNILNTDVEVSNLCLGTAKFGTIIDEKTSFELLDSFVELGGNFIDTANCYSNWFPGEESASEKTIGKWIAKNGREKIIVSTKGGYPDLHNKKISRLSINDIEMDIYNSLNNLRTTYIDIYWLHRDNINYPVSYFIDLLNDFKKRGIIRYFACSNWTCDRIIEAQIYAKKNNVDGFIANQMLWNIGKINQSVLNDDQLVLMDKTMFSYHENSNFTAIPYSSQANGFFSGTYNYLLNNNFCNANKNYEKIYYGSTAYELYYNHYNIEQLRKVRILSEMLEITQTQVILLYLMYNKFLTIPIIGCRNIEQLRESCNTSNLSNNTRYAQVIRDFMN